VSSVTTMNMALYGIPMVGSDICGFLGSPTEELCARWIEVGAFHPFSRNHNSIGEAPQELYRWDSVAEASRNALGMRYQLLPFMYTSFYHAQRDAELVTRPLWVNYPTEADTHTIDAQFMLGDGVLVSPVLFEGMTSVRAYFPAGEHGTTTWYSLFDDSVVEAGAGWVELDTPLTATNAHVPSGKVLPMHDTNDALTIVQAREAPYKLLVAAAASSSGDLMLDDGEQVELNEVTYVTYQYTQTDEGATLVAEVQEDGYKGAATSAVGKVVVKGAPAAWTTATVAGVSVPCTASKLSDGSSELEFDLSAVGLTANSAFTLTMKE